MSEFPAIPLEPTDKEGIRQYYESAIARIEAGETVVVRRNFDADFGRVYDVFADQKHVGFVEQEYEDMLCGVYKTPVDSLDGGPIALTNERLGLMGAMAIILNEVTA